MNTLSATPASPSFPRFFRFGAYWVNSYKVFLCIGVYAGILVSAAVGTRSGIPPLRFGLALLLFALVGLVGARIYHLVVNFHSYRGSGFSLVARSPVESGWSVLGGLVIVPLTLLFKSIAGIPVGVFWDHMGIAIAVGGGLIRFGCVCNGCCLGRESNGWFAIRQHDVHGVYRRRIPAQWLEIAWWLLACLGLMWLWPGRLATGSYGTAVIGWYGLGRAWLDPLREHSAMVYGFRIDRAVASLAATVAGFYLWHTL